MERKMKLKLLIAVAMVSLFFSVSLASATALPGTYYIEDTDFVWFNKNNKKNTWVFDLNSDPLVGVGGGGPDFDTPVDINPEDDILSAEFAILFWDDCDKGKKRKKEVAVLKFDGHKIWKKEIDKYDFFTEDALSYVLNDHILKVTVKRLKGDFGVCSVSLGGTYKDNSPVPEPTTMLLFGTGLASLAAVSRRKSM